MINFSRNFASEVTFVRLAHTVCRVVTRIIALTGPRNLKLKALNCCECSVEMVLEDVFGV